MRKKPIKSKKITAPGNAMIKYKCVVFFAASVAERQQKYFWEFVDGKVMICSCTEKGHKQKTQTIALLRLM